MNTLPRITEIIKIEPYKITCRWSTAEIRVLDFEKEFDKWEKAGKSFLIPLKNYEKFENVSVSDGTLQWYSVLLSYKDLKGNTQSKPLDLDPDVLYNISKPISLYKLVITKSNQSRKVANY